MTSELRAKFLALRGMIRRFAGRNNDTGLLQLGWFVDDVLETGGDWEALYDDLYQQFQYVEGGGEDRQQAKVKADLLKACKLIAPGLQCFSEKFSGTACGKKECPACAVHRAIAEAEGQVTP